MALHLDSLHEALTRTGKSQADLARELGVSKATITRWFTGQGEPETVERLKALAAALDTTLAALVGEENAAMTEKEKLLLKAFRESGETQADLALAMLVASKRQD